MRHGVLPRQRVLSLWFPDLPCDRVLRRARPAKSSPSPAENAAPGTAGALLVITARQRNAQRIVSLTEAARQAGIRRGEALADARARVPGLQAEEAEPEEDRKFLKTIADWCDRYTPLVALDGDAGLFLDITGCAHLLGGEKALLGDVLGRLNAQGLTACGAVADTPGAAWAVARYGEDQVVAPGEQRQALSGLPVAALRLETETVNGLGRVGLTHIGEIAGRPRAPLANRFGRELVLRLDQAFGLEGEPITPRFKTPLILAERRFFEPIGLVEDIKAVILSLAGQLAGALERRVEGGRVFELSLFRVDGVTRRTVVGTSRPLRDPPRVLALFAEKLKADETVLDAGYGYDLVRLAVLEAQGEEPSQTDLAGYGRAEAEADLAGLIDRFGARLGVSRVTRLQSVDRHLPEVQTALVPAATVRGEDLQWADPGGPLIRPLRLFDPAEPVEAVAMVPEGPPLRFRWRRVPYRVVRSEGPERIAPPWWVGADERAPAGREGVTRDYFRVEDEDGRRFWLYREGLYERETLRPRWFLHGVFA